MPQALKITIPAIVNTFIGLFGYVLGHRYRSVRPSGHGRRSPIPIGSALARDVYFRGAGVLYRLLRESRYSLYLERKLDTVTE